MARHGARPAAPGLWIGSTGTEGVAAAAHRLADAAAVWHDRGVNEATLRVILQAISSLAIAGGLVYTAVQFRASHRSQYVTNFTKLVELQLGLRKMRVEDPTLAHMYLHNDGAGDSAEEIRAYFYNLMQLSLFEIAWFSHRHGQLPDDYFRSWERHMTAIAAEPSFRRMWTTDASKILHDEFRRYMNALVAGAPVTFPEGVGERGLPRD